MGGVRGALRLQRVARQELVPGALQVARLEITPRQAINLRVQRRLDADGLDALLGGHDDPVKIRMAGRDDRGGNLARQVALDEGAVQARRFDRPAAVVPSPGVDRRPAGKYPVQQKERREVGVGRGRRVKRDVEIGRPRRPAQRQAPLAALRRLLRPHLRRIGAGANLPEVAPDETESPGRVEITRHHENRVVRDVVPAVVGVQVVARDRPQVRQVPDGRPAVGMSLQRGPGDLLVEIGARVVLASLELGDDDGPFAIDLGSGVQALGHARGLETQHRLQGVALHRLEIRGHVQPGVPVPGAAGELDQTRHVVLADRSRPLEIHVLDPVGDPGDPGPLVARPDPVPAPDGDHRRVSHLAQDDGEAVGQTRRLDPGSGTGAAHARFSRTAGPPKAAATPARRESDAACNVSAR